MSEYAQSMLAAIYETEWLYFRMFETYKPQSEFRKIECQQWIWSFVISLYTSYIDNQWPLLLT